MNQQQYISIKKFLSNYQFDNKTTLHKLHEAYSPHIPFKKFVSYIKSMGVSSKSVRVQSGVERHYFYEPKNDKYLLELFDVFETCPSCKGKGVIQVNLSDTEQTFIKKTIDIILSVMYYESVKQGALTKRPEQQYKSFNQKLLTTH